MCSQRLFKKGMDAYERQNFGIARKNFEKLLSMNANHLDSRYLLGTLYAQQGQRAKAFYHLNLAATLDPNSPMIQTNLGILYQQEGNLFEAEKHFRRAIALDGSLYQAHYNLGVILEIQNRFADAIESLMVTIQLVPSLFDAQLRLGKLFHQVGNHAFAEKTLQKALEFQPNHLGALHTLANVFAATNKLEDAKRTYQRILKLNPGDSSASYVMSIFEGQNPSNPPSEHFRNIFDEMAKSFDKHLDTLGYSAPQKLYDMLMADTDRAVEYQKMLDIGCGTGAAGRVFRNNVDRLVGIDISENMIERSRGQNIYDELKVALIDELSDKDTGYDLIVAADVFPYIGDLNSIFGKISKIMSKEGYLLFTTERHANTGAYHIDNATGRYQFSDTYLSQLADKYGFQILEMNIENLRQEKGEWLPGHYCLWQKCS